MGEWGATATITLTAEEQPGASPVSQLLLSAQFCTNRESEVSKGENKDQELPGSCVSLQQFPRPAELGQRLARRIRGKQWVVKAHDIYIKINQICCLADQNTNPKWVRDPQIRIQTLASSMSFL